MALFLFAAVMSSDDSYLYHTNAALENDLQILEKLPKALSLRTKIRINITLLLIVSMVVALALPNIIKIAFLFTSLALILGVMGMISRFARLSLPGIYMLALPGMPGALPGGSWLRALPPSSPWAPLPAQPRVRPLPHSAGRSEGQIVFNNI